MFHKWVSRKSSFSRKAGEKHAKGLGSQTLSSVDDDLSKSSGDYANIPVFHRRVISLPAEAFYLDNNLSTDAQAKATSAELVRRLQEGQKSEHKKTLKALRDAQPEVRVAFVESGGARVLVESLMPKKPHKEALQALVACLETSTELHAALCRHGAIGAVVKQLNVGSRSCKKWAARAVPYLVGCCPNVERDIASSGGLESLVSMLHSSNERRREIAAQALASLAKDNQEVQRQIAEQDGLANLSAMLPKGGTTTRSMVVKTLANVIASDPALQARAATVGGEHLLKQLKEDDSVLRKESVRAVAYITAVSEGRQVVLDRNGMRDLVEMVELGETQQEEWVLEAILNLTKQKDSMAMLLHEGILQRLAQVLLSPELACREKSVRILGKLSQFDVFNKQWVGKGRAVRTLVSLLYNSSGQVQEGAAFALANISKSYESRRKMYEWGVIKPLVVILGGVNEPAKRWACQILSKLGGAEDMVLGMVNEGVVDAVVRVIYEGTGGQEQWAMEVLSTVAEAPYPWIRGRVCSTGVMDVLLKFLNSEVPDVQLAAAGCIGVLIDNHWESQQMVMGNGIQPLIRLLVNGQDELKHAAVHVLARLSHMESCNRDLAAQWQTIRALEGLLQTKETIVMQDAANVLADLATTKGPAMMILQTCNILSLLLGMLRSSEHAGLCQAARAVGNLALQSPMAKARVANDARALTTLVNALEADDLSTRAQGAHALASVMLRDPILQSRVAQLGVLGSLMEMLDVDDEECNVQGARALAFLVEDHPPNQIAVAQGGALRHLVELLSKSRIDCRRESAHAIANLTHHSIPNQLAIVQAGGVPRLVDILASDDVESCRHAVRSFANLASSNEVPVIDARRAGIGPLISIIQTGDKRCREQAARALANLACGDSEQEIIAKVKGIPPLVELVRTGSSLAQEQAARALANLSCKDANLPAIVKAGGISALVRLLKSPSGSCRKQAAGALANLACNNSENCSAVVMAGGVPDLVELLSSDNDACREQAVRAVGNLACTHQNQQALLAEGCARKLIAMLKFHGDRDMCKQRVVRALANMAADSKASQLAIIDEGAVEPLVALLGSKECGFQDETKRALMLLACGTDSKVHSSDTILLDARSKVVASILGVRLGAERNTTTKMTFLQECRNGDGTPRQLMCPITHELMREPVIARDGHTYEKAAIVEWFRNRNSSPMTNEPLKSTSVIPNVLVQGIISEFKESRNQAGPE